MRLQTISIIGATQPSCTHEVWAERHHLVMMALTLADLLTLTPETLTEKLGMGHAGLELLARLRDDVRSWDATLLPEPL